MLSNRLLKAILVTVSASVVAPWTAQSVNAHEIWFAQRSAKLALIYGTGSEDLDTVKRFSKIVAVSGYDGAGNPVAVSVQPTDSLVVVNVDNDPAVVAATFDNGLWTKDSKGVWHAKGRNEVADAVVSGHNYKYGTFLRKLPPGPVSPAADLKFQVVAVGKVFPKAKDQKLTVQVLYDGKPVPAARVFRDMVTDPSAKPLLTNQRGEVTFPVRNDGLNVVMAMHMTAPEDPATTFATEHVATLSFLYPPPPE